MKKLTVLLALINSMAYGKSPHALVDEACRRYKVKDCDLVHAIVYRESGYDLSKKKILDTNMEFSYGLMQVQCPTARLMGLKFNCEQLAESPLTGLHFGILYLKYQLKRYKNNHMLAVAAYNSGTAIVCKDYNPGKCYPGEVWNYAYWDSIRRRYKWLRTERLKRQRASSKSLKTLGGSVKSQTVSKLESRTSLEHTKEPSSGSKLKQLVKSPPVVWPLENPSIESHRSNWMSLDPLKKMEGLVLQ